MNCLRAIALSLVAVFFAILPARADTVFYYHSQPGDFAGQGLTRTIRPGDGFTVGVESYPVYLLVIFNAADQSGPGGPTPLVRLTPPPASIGIVENTKTSGATGQQGFAFTNNGNQLCESTGRYEILELSYDGAGGLSSLALNFRQTCNGSIASSYGQLRYNSAIPLDTAVRAPDPFVFTAVTGAALSTEYISPAAAIAGLTEAVPVAITGGEYSIDNGPFTAIAGVVQAGQSIRVRLTSAAIANSLRTATLDVGEYRTEFRVGTAAGPAPQPNGEPLAAFISQSDNVTRLYSPALNKTVTTQAGAAGQASVTASVNPYSFFDHLTVTLTGANSSPLSPGTYANVPAIATISQPALGIDSYPLAACYDPTARANMTVHEIEYLPDGRFGKLALDFMHGCMAGNAGKLFGWIRINSLVPIDYSIRLPSPFAFPPIANAPTGASVVSQEIPIQGINVPVPISIAGGEYSIAGAPFTGASGTITAGQRIRLRLITSAQTNMVSTATVTIGEGSASFSVGTAPSATEQPDGRPLVVLREHHFTSQPMSTSVLGPATLFNIAPVANVPGLSMEARPFNAAYDYYTWRLYARGANNVPPAPGTYENIMGPGLATEPAFSTSMFLGGGLSCESSPTSTNYTIHEVAYSPEQVVTKLALDFVERCPDSNIFSSNDAYAVFGNVRFNSTVPIDYSIRLPRRFSFGAVGNILPGATAISNEITVDGINVAVPVTVSGVGAEYSIDGAPFTAMPGMIVAGQKIRVRAPAAAQPNTIIAYAVNIGEGSAQFNVGSKPAANQQPDGSPLVVLISQGNDSIGHGRNYAFSPATFSFVALGVNYDRGVWMYSNGPADEHWDFNFAAPNDVEMVPGTYTSAMRWPFQDAGRPGMSVTGNSSGCGDVSGTFTVHEIEYVNANTGYSISKVALDFVHSCQGGPPLYGYLRFNSTVPIAYFVDTVPTPFVFADRNGVARGATVVSNAVTLEGFSGSLPISVAGGAYSIDGGAFTTSPGIISPGQVVALQVVAPPAFYGSATASLTVGGVIGSFTVRTDAADSFPDPFTLGTASGVSRSQWIYSTIVTPAGFNSSANVAIQGGEFSIAGGAFSATPAMIEPGQSVQVRLMSSAAFSDYRVATLTIGYTQAAFTVQTEIRFALNIAVAGPGSVNAGTVALTCLSDCTEYLPAGTSISLTAVAAPGTAFAGWSGACAGNGDCSLSMSAVRSVTATFAPLPPGAPVIAAALPGNGLAIIAFSAPLQTGGPAIGGYAATCNPGNIGAMATASPITVNGLTNDVMYTCSVTAANSAGTGPSSATVGVTPTAMSAFALIGVRSRKSHGAAGNFDLVIESTPAGSLPTVEPRAIGAGHTIVFQFNATVTIPGSATLVDHLGMPTGSVAVTASANEVLVTLGGVADRERVTLTLAGVNGTLSSAAAIGFLLGDVNQSGSIEADDVRALKARSGQAANGTNFRYDINTSGEITASEVIAVKSRMGTSMP